MVKLILIPFVILVLFITNGFTETITLKNGKEIIGDIVKETDKVIVVSRQNGDFVYTISRGKIRRIRKSTPDETEWRQKQEHNTYSTSQEASRRETASEFRMERYRHQVRMAERARGAERIPFFNNRRGVVEALLNDKVKALLRVDTGASVVTISAKLAKKLGFGELTTKKKITFTLANGSEARGVPVILDAVKVGSAKAENIEAVVMRNASDRGTDGLLGMSFLSHFKVRLDPKENFLTLERQ